MGTPKAKVLPSGLHGNILEKQLWGSAGMKIKIILLSDLSTNKPNDRHGALVNESSAVEWLLNHGAEHLDIRVKTDVCSSLLNKCFSTSIKKFANSYKWLLALGY